MQESRMIVSRVIESQTLKRRLEVAWMIWRSVWRVFTSIRREKAMEVPSKARVEDSSIHVKHWSFAFGWPHHHKKRLHVECIIVYP